MGTIKLVEPGAEIYLGERRNFGDLQIVLAKISGSINYRRFCETHNLAEDDFSLK